MELRTYRHAKEYYDNFISILKKRKAQKIEELRRLSKIKYCLELSYIVAATMFTMGAIIFSCFTDETKLRTSAIVMFMFVFIAIILGCMYLLYLIIRNIDITKERIRDLDYKIENTELIVHTNAKFDTIEFASKNNWFLDSLEEINKLDIED